MFGNGELMKRLAICLLFLFSARAEDLQTFTIGHSTGVNIPANTWVDMTATITGQMPDYMTYYDKSFFVPALGMVADLGSWREPSSEPNRSWMLYDPMENRIWPWSFNSTWHNEEAPEGGHPMGQMNIDPTTSNALGRCCSSGAQVSDNPAVGNYFYDFWGGVGRVTMPVQNSRYDAQLGSASYDPFNRKVVYQSGVSGDNTFIYDPVTNAMAINVQGSPAPATNLTHQAMATNNADQDIYMFGGAIGSTASAGLWKYNTLANTWTELDGTQTCNISKRTGLAACPTARLAASFTYDDNEGLFFLFGGVPTWPALGASLVYHDLWTYDPVANAWTELSPGCISSGGFCDSTGGNGPTDASPANGGSGASFTAERFTYIRELDAFYYMSQSGSANSSRRIWLYRYVPGGRVATASRNHIYTVNPSAAEFRVVGTLNRNSTCQDPQGNNCGPTTQSQAYGGEIASNGSTLYQIWTETSSANNNGYYGHPYAQSWSQATGAQFLGAAFSAISGDASGGVLESTETSVAVVGTVAWACFGGQGTSFFLRVYCRGWDGSGWNIGGQVPSVNGTGNLAYDTWPSLISNNGVPIVAEIERCNAPCNVVPNETFGYVFQWVSNAWAQLGGAIMFNIPATPGSSARVPHVDSISAASDGTNPWVAWTEYQTQFPNAADRVCFDQNNLSGSANCPNASHPRLYLAKWNGSSWAVQCGGSGNVSDSNWAYFASITYMGSKAYVAHLERTVTGIQKLYVRSCDGTTWATVGGNIYLNRDQTWGWVFRPEITNDGTNLYVTWAEQGNDQPWIATLGGTSGFSQKPRVYVSQWDGSTWTKLGGALNVDTQYGAARHPSIAILNGQPVVQWSESLNGNLGQMYTKQWNGTDWGGLGTGSLTITTNSLPAWTTGGTYSQTLAASGGTPPYVNWTIVSGSLPAGTSLNASTGVIGGTVTGAPGTSIFSVQVTDSAASAATASSGPLSVTINAAADITTLSPLPSGTVGAVYLQTLAATGGTGPLVWDLPAGLLPAGLALSAGGTIGGTPTQAGPFSFTVRVTDAASVNYSQPYLLTIAGPGNSTSTTISGSVSVSGKATLQ